MEIHQLRYFVAVVQAGSFTQAAEECFVSQPSLSQAIHKLERELRQPMFERLGRGIKLTDAGHEFFQHAVRALEELDDAKRRIAEGQETGRGHLTVGAIPTIAPYFLPAVLSAFSRRFPQAEVTIIEDVTEHMLKRCLAGEVDVALLSLPIADSQLHVEPLFREPLLVALPKKHPLARKRQITLEDVTAHPFILLSEAHCLGEQILSFCRQNECLPAVSCQSAQLLTVLELVALGRGLSLIPEMARRHDTSKHREYRPLADQRVNRAVAMAWHKDRFQPPLVKSLVSQLRKIAVKRA